MEFPKNEIIVIGAGNFGTCLAQHLGTKGFKVLLSGRSPEVTESINRSRKNPKYLSHISLSENITACTHLTNEDIKLAKYIVLAVPTQSLRSVIQSISPTLSPQVILICVSKGIESGTLKFPLQIISEVLPASYHSRAAILSGPSFAAEIAEQQPTAVAIGCKNEQVCIAAQELFHTPSFRVYSTHDPMGLEVAGALKNVIALAAGAASGLGFQQNARAALLTRGLAEMTRIGVMLGSDPLTFLGLGGVGDLILTCSSEKSRNFTVGYRLGKGEALQRVLETIGSVAEGVTTARAAYELTSKLSVDAPMIHSVYSVLYGNTTIQTALASLLNREMKREANFNSQKTPYD